MALTKIDNWDESLGITNTTPTQDTKEEDKHLSAKIETISLSTESSQSTETNGATNQTRDEDGSLFGSNEPMIIETISLSTESSQSTETNGATNQTRDEDVSSADLSYMRKVLRNKLLHTKNNVEVTRSLPNSPLYSAKTFEELRLPDELLKGLYEMGFSAPSKIQETALPLLLATPPINLIAQSQSGTGKTAAFVLASLCRVEANEFNPQVIILSPTYELAIQTGEVAKQMAKHIPRISFRFAVRGENIQRGEQISEHVIIGTPGKLMDWIHKFKAFDARKIKVFVLDEADVMIDTQGHRQQSIRIQKALPMDCQMMLFSATYDKNVMEFAEMIIRDPVIIRLKREEESLENINQFYVYCHNEDDKYKALANIFGTISMGQAFIFCHTKASAARLAQTLRKDGHSVGLISGDLSVEERTMALQRFREGQERVLIATNVMARGIDVEQVTVVVNYDLPINVETREVDKETYLHRIGRTGRFGKEGLA
ncbi:unnamed protein product, partial [Oppiella nova]